MGAAEKIGVCNKQKKGGKNVSCQIYIKSGK